MPYEQTTEGIRIAVDVDYVPPGQHQFGQGRYVWAYTITIDNESHGTVRLRTRHWTITDGRGHVETVDGEGVVGETPIIPPGDSFTYTSACPLTVPSGTMGGHYVFTRADGRSFQVTIPTFSLDLPNQKRVLN